MALACTVRGKRNLHTRAALQAKCKTAQLLNLSNLGRFSEIHSLALLILVGDQRIPNCWGWKKPRRPPSSTPLPWAGTASTRAGCSKPRPAQPGTPKSCPGKCNQGFGSTGEQVRGAWSLILKGALVPHEGRVGVWHKKWKIFTFLCPPCSTPARQQVMVMDL